MINKFWAKSRMVFIGIGIMSISTFWLMLFGEIFGFEIDKIIFIVIGLLSIVAQIGCRYMKIREDSGKLS